MSSMEELMGAGVAAMKELGTTMLGCGDVTVQSTSAGVQHAEAGAYLALLGEETVEIALVADEAGCSAAARLLLGMTPDEEISPSDVADACCELVNIASGFVKRNPAFEAMKTGLPLFVRGQAVFRENVDASTVELAFDDLKLSLIVIRMRAPGSA